MYDNFLALLNISELFKSQIEICEVVFEHKENLDNRKYGSRLVPGFVWRLTDTTRDMGFFQFSASPSSASWLVYRLALLLVAR